MFLFVCDKGKHKQTTLIYWRDVKNVVYNDKYSNKMDKMKKEGWYPDCWFSFLAFGAPSKISSPSLYIDATTLKNCFHCRWMFKS